MTKRPRAPARPAAEDNEIDATFRWSPSRSARTLSLPEQIAETIGNAIIKGDLEPGQRIQEFDIAAEFDVSRGPVREALRILERDGMVSILPRRGAQVTQLDVNEVNDVFAIRASLLGLAARLIAENPDPALIDDLKQHAERLTVLAKSDADGDRYISQVYYMNMTLAAGCGNTRLGELMFSLAHQTLRYSKLGLSTSERRQQSARNWNVLLKHLQKREPDKAQVAAERLVQDSRAMAVSLLGRQQAAHPDEKAGGRFGDWRPQAGTKGS